MDCILCKALWILHLSRKTEAENTVLLAGFYEITAWGIHFWGYVCICVSVYDAVLTEDGLVQSGLRKSQLQKLCACLSL